MKSKKDAVHFQSEGAIIKTINRFCYAIALSSIFDIFLYAYMGLYAICGILVVIGVLFLWFVYLNKKSHYKISRAAIIITTNLGVIVFSAFLGFKLGIFFFLFATPHLTYLLYNFKEKFSIFLCLLSYLITFITIYLIDNYQLYPPTALTKGNANLIYTINFSVSLVLSFILITFFASNNNTVSEMLTTANTSLQEKQIHLESEIAEKSKINTALARTLKEKEILLSEIHHRVKNNLAVISGLIELQTFYVKDEKASAILKESRNRIKSIAVLHEKFYESKNLEKIGIRSYVDELIYFIKLSFSSQQKDIKIITQIEDIELSMANALPFSLLLNELITNSYKHAFKKQDSGNITISLIKYQNKLVLNFKDDGCGFELAEINKDNSLGMNLIEAFSLQLKANTNWASKPNKGVEFTLQFKQDLINSKEQIG
ncbi:MAG TPA: sensor histidine kinase [Bacteroidia bacterium]|jgi:two-component sensor histidine kinase|nr:sensor histidine kinase [Bacteroidia bacterium]